MPRPEARRANVGPPPHGDLDNPPATEHVRAEEHDGTGEQLHVEAPGADERSGEEPAGQSGLEQFRPTLRVVDAESQNRAGDGREDAPQQVPLPAADHHGPQPLQAAAAENTRRLVIPGGRKESGHLVQRRGQIGVPVADVVRRLQFNRVQDSPAHGLGLAAVFRKIEDHGSPGRGLGQTLKNKKRPVVAAVIDEAEPHARLPAEKPQELGRGQAGGFVVAGNDQPRFWQIR